MPYLTQNFPFTFDIVLQVGIQGIVCCHGNLTVHMIHILAENMTSPTTVCTSNMKVCPWLSWRCLLVMPWQQNLYWTLAQQLAHHSITGCNMSTGDLLATGTISGKVVTIAIEIWLLFTIWYKQKNWKLALVTHFQAISMHRLWC